MPATDTYPNFVMVNANRPQKPAWVVSGLTVEEGRTTYEGKHFRVRYSTDHAVIVRVEKVAVHGGAVLTFCSVVKTVKRWRNKKVLHKATEMIYPGRLEAI